MSRREQTTAHLRDAAARELLDVGPRALTHGGIARRAYFSEAAVYQRWADRRAVIEDLVRALVEPTVNLLAAESRAAGGNLIALGHWVATTTATPDARRTMQLVAEVGFAARDDESLASMAIALIDTLRASVPLDDVPPLLANALRWWFVGTALGCALLHRCGCDIPTTHEAVARAVQRACEPPDTLPTPASPPSISVVPNEVPGQRPPVDDVAAAIMAASRRRIVDENVDAVTVRAASNDAGVTTGALYRRWPNRSALLEAVVAQEGLGDQYRWLLDLLSSASEGLDSVTGRAALERAASVARKVWSEPDSRAFLLEMAVAAHTSAQLCARLAEQVHAVVSARAAEVATAAELGLVTGPMTPLELTWFLQTPPVALRLMSVLGIEPTHDEYVALLRMVAVMVWGD